MALFEFILDGPPVSQQTRRRERLHQWKETVRREAERHWPQGTPPRIDLIRLRITYFYDANSVDVDNIPKPISDALNGLAFADDSQITDSYCRKRNLNQDFVIETASSVLAEGFERRREFLHVVVDTAPDQRLVD